MLKVYLLKSFKFTASLKIIIGMEFYANGIFWTFLIAFCVEN